MYVCQICGTVVPAGQPRQLIVKEETYKHPYRPNAFRKWHQSRKNGRWYKDWVDDVGGTGTRIVKEIPVCVSCKAGERPTT